MNIAEAIADPSMFGPFFGGASWDRWRVFLKVTAGLPLSEPELETYRHHTGRTGPPAGPSDETVLICGRRAGKSFVLATLGVFYATVPDYSGRLSPGETPTVAIIAADKRQARTIFRYARGLLTKVDLLAPLLDTETAESLTLTTGVVIEVHVASYRSVRGYTLACCLCDEVAFWRADDSAANPDTEILNAVRPALGTLNGPLFIGSSPYAKRGALYTLFRDNWGREDAEVLIWRGGTAEMNPLFPARIIEKALAEDPDAAGAEYLAEWRQDVAAFVSREVVEAATATGRFEAAPLPGVRYVGFVDPSGGSSDAMTLGIAHKQGEVAVLDCAREIRPPFVPDAVVAQFAETLKSYRITKVVGDRYAAGWPPAAFAKHGITYEPSEFNKSEIYGQTLPLLNSGRVELLDLPRLRSQLIGLERRTTRGGRETIDHGPGAHDDLINAAAGALVLALARRSAPALVDYSFRL